MDSTLPAVGLPTAISVNTSWSGRSDNGKVNTVSSLAPSTTQWTTQSRSCESRPEWLRRFGFFKPFSTAGWLGVPTKWTDCAGASAVAVSALLACPARTTGQGCRHEDPGPAARAGTMRRMIGLTIPLAGSIVALEPLEEEHAEGLWRAAQAPEIWEWLAHIGSSRDYFDRWLAASLERAEAGAEGPFAVRDQRGGELIGSTRYLNLRPPDRVVEIGWTWLNPSAWGTGANVESKLLLMSHAFEQLRCLRVELKTDARNRRSRAAMAAIPAQFEGILRKHMTVPDVGVRDSAYYSVIDDEWPVVRANLESRLARHVQR
ncbi:MAG TPA: GNAT family protein [Solirubrobacterales bacterium]|nr:GNAT family protein [Solirubrobacterales bacterium]